LVAEAVGAAAGVAAPSLGDILEADVWARTFAAERIAGAVSRA